MEGVLWCAVEGGRFVVRRGGRAFCGASWREGVLWGVVDGRAFCGASLMGGRFVVRR